MRGLRWAELTCPARGSAWLADAVKRDLPTWVSPIDATRKDEVLACTKEVIDELWPALKDAYMQEVLESCVHRCDAARSVATTPYVCTHNTAIRASHDKGSTRKGKLRTGEVINVIEARDGYMRFVGGWVSADRLEKRSAELAPEPELSAAPMVTAPIVGGGMALDLQTPSDAPVVTGGGGIGGGFDLMGGTGASTAAPAFGGGLDLLAPAPASGGFDLLGGSVAAPPVVTDPFAAVMVAPQPPAVASPDPFGLLAAPTAAPADPFGVMAVSAPAPAPAAAPANGVDFLGGLAGGPPAAAVEDLPAGWVKKESKQYAGRFFYFHAATNTTTWDKPTAATALAAPAAAPAADPGGSPKSGKKGKLGGRGMMGKAKAAKAAMEQAAAAAAAVGVKESSKAEQPLPPGWEKKESSQYPGKSFYYNQATNTTTWERPTPTPAATAAVAPVASEPAGTDLLGMFAAPPAPAPAPPVTALGLPPSVAAPQPGGAATRGSPRTSSTTTTPASADGSALPNRCGTIKKETGVRHIWQPRYLKLGGGVLSWSKYETDTVDRGSIVLDTTWDVGIDELKSGCSPADVDGAGALVRVGSSAKDGGFVFRVHKKNDHQNRLYFDADTEELRNLWLADIQASIDGAPKTPTAKITSDDSTSSVVSAKKAGKFMKGMRKQMQAAAMSGIGAAGGEPADFDDDKQPVFAIACPSRSGLLQKESTGMRHQWEPRHFELSNTGQLHYYKPEANTKTDEPQGRVPLGPRWRVMPSWHAERPYSIKVWDGVNDATQAVKDHAYFLQAETEEDQLGWVEDIQTAIFAMHFGEMDVEQVLLQRAMMRVYKRQKDEQGLPYEQVAVAEYALDNLCYARALDGLSGFIDYHLKAVPAEAQDRAREALQHAVLAIVEQECDETWAGWERQVDALHKQAESLLMHPATMDALLQHETQAHAQLEGLLSASVRSFCTREVVPGVKRALQSQITPCGEFVKAMVPQAISAHAMLKDVVQCGASPNEASLQALLDATAKAVSSWVETIGVTASGAAGGADTSIVSFLEQDVFPCVGKSMLAMLSCVSPLILSTAVVEGLTGLDELEDEVSMLRDPTEAHDLCSDVEDDIGKRFISEMRRISGLALLRQQQVMSSTHPDLTVALSHGLNIALVQCVVEAVSAFFHSMHDSLETDNVDTSAPPISGAGYLHAVSHCSRIVHF